MTGNPKEEGEMSDLKMNHNRAEYIEKYSSNRWIVNQKKPHLAKKKISIHQDKIWIEVPQEICQIQSHCIIFRFSKNWLWKQSQFFQSTIIQSTTAFSSWNLCSDRLLSRCALKQNYSDAISLQNKCKSTVIATIYRLYAEYILCLDN